MAKLSLSEQFDRALQAILAHPGSTPDSQFDARLRPLLLLAGELGDLPRRSFKDRLKSDLQGRASMTTPAMRSEEVSAVEMDAMAKQAPQPAHPEAPSPVPPIPEGFHTITPYVIVAGASRFIDFLAQTFGAVEEVRVPTPDGKIMHARVRIGDAMLELADSNAQYPPLPMPLHVYVADVESVFHRAVEAGCTVLHPPSDQDYGDRDFAVRDAFGNHWYVGTPMHGAPRPAGLTAVTPYLHPEGTAKFIEFLKGAFGAEELLRAADPAGHVHHAKIRIGDSILEMSDPHAPYGTMPCALHLYVENTDAWYDRAMRAGAASIEAPTDKPYGDRSAGVRDPFGNQWFIATHIRDVRF